MQDIFVQPIHTTVTGRARFQVHGLYNSELMKQHLESGLSNDDGIRSFSINTLTGNILVFYQWYNTHIKVAARIEGLVLEYKKSNGNRLLEKKKRRVQKSIWITSERKDTHGKARAKQREKILKILPVGTANQMIEPWHLKGVDYVLNRFMTDKDMGLSRDVTDIRLKKYGLNILKRFKT